MTTRRLALLLLLCACGGDASWESPRSLASVERRRMEHLVVATGTIEPEDQVELRARVPGIIHRLHVEAGDRIEKGQLLVEIEREMLKAAVEEATAALEVARSDQRYLRSERDRIGNLADRDAASTQQLEEVRARADAADARVRQARATLKRLRVELGYATVVAPSAGRVLDVAIEEGSAVSPVTAVTGGTVLMLLAVTDVLHLDGLLDETEIRHVRPGQTARVEVEAYPDRSFDGVVRKIAPVGQRQQNVTYFEVEVQITDPEAHLLKPRMSGDAKIVTSVFDDAVAVPDTALLYDGDHVFVETAHGDPPTYQRREVTTGIVDGGFVQILSGLDSAERVAVW